jgi:cyclohexyl-isocyanide hydratase
VKTRDGFGFIPHKTFDQVPRVDLLWVPGGDPAALVVQMRNTRYVEFIQSRSENAEYVTSVCEGALIAANAGLFDGHEITTHWAFIECLKRYPVKVAPGNPRYVHDRNRVTGAGISSGFDEALYLVKVIAGEDNAERIQRIMQYFPDPPVSGSIPDAPRCPLEGQIPVEPPQ